MTPRRFSRTNQPVKCKACGKLTTQDVDGAGLSLCRRCYEEAGLENEHQDGLHDAAPVKGCPACEEEETHV